MGLGSEAFVGERVAVDRRHVGYVGRNQWRSAVETDFRALMRRLLEGTDVNKIALVLEALGAFAVVIGVALVFPPAAFIVGGILLILFALAADS